MTNDNTPSPAWTCLDCQLAPGATLCRRADGSHTFERLARAYLADSDDGHVSDERHRALDCVTSMVTSSPAAAVGFLIVACAQCSTLAELATIAAGPLEDLLEAHGSHVIGPLEKVAKIDPRFRLMVSGTWGQDRVEPEVWSRLKAAVAPGPVIDADARTPAAGLADRIATKAQLAVLFAPVSGAKTGH